MADITLNAQTRTDIRKNLSAARKEGLLPAVVYGPDFESKTIYVNHNEFVKVLEAAGESTIIKLKLDEKEELPVLINDYQTDPVIGNYLHLDLYKFDATKKTHAEVELDFVGEAPAVKLGGYLVKKRDVVEIECLPSDLIHEITVDLSVLKTFEDAIHVSDLNVPEAVTILDEPTGLVAKVEEIQEVVEEEPAAETISAADIPTVEGEKKEGEEGSEENKEENKG